MNLFKRIFKIFSSMRIGSAQIIMTFLFTDNPGRQIRKEQRFPFFTTNYSFTFIHRKLCIFIVAKDWQNVSLKQRTAKYNYVLKIVSQSPETAAILETDNNRPRCAALLAG